LLLLIRMMQYLFYSLIILFLSYLFFKLFLNKVDNIEGLENNLPENLMTILRTCEVEKNCDKDPMTYGIKLANLRIEAENDNRHEAADHIKEYEKINKTWQDIYDDEKEEKNNAIRKAAAVIQESQANTFMCKIANSAWPFAWSITHHFCKPKYNSTRCHNWIDNFDGWCKAIPDEDTEDKDNDGTGQWAAGNVGGGKRNFGLGEPSQIVAGEKDKYAGGCPGGTPSIPFIGGGGAGGQGRAQCAFGYAGAEKLPTNSTQCYEMTHDFDWACREQAGANLDYKKGVTSDYVFGVKDYLDDGSHGCLGGQRRVQCALGHAGGKELEPNSTKCYEWTHDFNAACRDQAGNGQPFEPSKELPSQEIWGEKKKYDSGCLLGQGRAECAKGYTSSTKLYDWSSKCGKWLDDFNVKCQETYGDEWMLDTRVEDSTIEYGKYQGGCSLEAGRGICIKKSDISANVEVWGAKCGAWFDIGPKYCKNDFGPEFAYVGREGADCANGQGRAKCKRIKPGSVAQSGCSLWTSIDWGGEKTRDQYCGEDFGEGWIARRATEADVANPEINKDGKLKDNLGKTWAMEYDCGWSKGATYCMFCGDLSKEDCIQKYSTSGKNNKEENNEENNNEEEDSVNK
jgi:hypothetical protein